MLQRPTNKIDTQNKFKKNTEQPILQWPTNRITTPNKSKSKTEQPIIQWPSKNLATPPKNTRNNLNIELRKTYNKELNKLNANQTTLAHTENKEKPTNTKEQQSNPSSKKLDESDNGADRQTDISTHRIQGHKNIFEEKKYNPANLSVY